MNVKFSTYEYIGIIAPGSILIFALYTLFWLPGKSEPTSVVSLGELGIFILLSFVAGHLLQALGNLIEEPFWKLAGGWPTNKILKPDQNLLSHNQIFRLRERVAKDFGIDFDIITQQEWWSITREIDNLIQNHPGYGRIASFNQTYGLMRGVFVGLALVFIIITVYSLANWPVAILMAFFALLALYRMHRFGCHYGKELLLAYLTRPVS